MNYFALMWAIVIVVAIVVEASTANLVSIWFMPGALIALILSLFHVPIVWQAVVFFVVSVALLILSRKFVKKLTGKVIRTNADSLIGQNAVITEEVCNIEERGAAKIGGQVWTARALNDEDILVVGDIVVVQEIRGVKLICRKKEK